MKKVIFLLIFSLFSTGAFSSERGCQLFSELITKILSSDEHSYYGFLDSKRDEYRYQYGQCKNDCSHTSFSKNVINTNDLEAKIKNLSKIRDNLQTIKKSVKEEYQTIIQSLLKELDGDISPSSKILTKKE